MVAKKEVTRLLSTLKKPQAEIRECRFSFRINTFGGRSKLSNYSEFLACLSCSSPSRTLSSSSRAITVSASTVNLRRTPNQIGHGQPSKVCRLSQNMNSKTVSYVVHENASQPGTCMTENKHPGELSQYDKDRRSGRQNITLEVRKNNILLKMFHL